MATRNSKVLVDFVSYCIDHPEERFWQALRNWSRFSFIMGGTDHTEGNLIDTFYFEGKDK